MPTRSFDEHAEVFERTRASCVGHVERLAEVICASLRKGGKVLFFGNGGSASDAQHLATELSVRFVRNRRAIPGLALGSNVSELTACANDFGFDRVFARQIEALGNAGDVAVGISTSGRSPNIVSAFETAKANGLSTAAFTGEAGIAGSADVVIAVPSSTTARIQEMHALLGHILCETIERNLGL